MPELRRNPSKSGAEDNDSPQQDAAGPTAAAPKGMAEEVSNSLPEPATAAFAALLHLLRLMAADLVLGRPDVDIDRFEQAVRAKIEQFVSPTANQSAREAGLAFARFLVEQVLVQVRAQVEIKKSLSPQRQTTQAEKPAPSPAAVADAGLPKFLN
jgi:hypothetical protein